MVSQSWKALSTGMFSLEAYNHMQPARSSYLTIAFHCFLSKPEERQVWEDIATKDKARYEAERQAYKGPWKVPANKRTPKDPNAPRRPASAFLSYSNRRRAALKRQHPDATNADLSKMLSKSWKELPPDEKSVYVEAELELRAKYKVEMATWRKKVAEEKKAERKEREAMAMQAAEARQNEMGADEGGGQQQQPGGDAMPGGFQNAAMYGNPYAAAMPPGSAGTGGATNGGGGDSNSFGGGGGFPNIVAGNPFAAQQLLSGAAGLPGQQQFLQQLLGKDCSSDIVTHTVCSLLYSILDHCPLMACCI